MEPAFDQFAVQVFPYVTAKQIRAVYEHCFLLPVSKIKGDTAFNN